MLVNCNSCQKKFKVPETAITKAGRLLQCGSCGNKWTQYPAEESSIEEIKNKISTKINKPSNINKIKTLPKNKKKRAVNLYTDEYLRKKHGLVINDPTNNNKKKNSKNKDARIGFGFFSYFFTISILVITLFGFINLSKDIIIINYPSLETHINYLYEILDIAKTSISNFIN
jgi:predicted Zn finger-like uncharacterized protein|tara:strand:+ start:133 stop:648 length:516 start_codon:yes stop_codon:yes gene_type:complete